MLKSLYAQLPMLAIVACFVVFQTWRSCSSPSDVPAFQMVDYRYVSEGEPGMTTLTVHALVHNRVPGQITSITLVNGPSILAHATIVGATAHGTAFSIEWHGPIASVLSGPLHVQITDTSKLLGIGAIPCLTTDDGNQA